MTDFDEKLSKHEQWTIEDRKFLCKKCGYIPDDSEQKWLSQQCWSVYSVDIHRSDLVPKIDAKTLTENL